MAIFFNILLMCSLKLLLFPDQVKGDNDLTNPALKIKYTNQFKFLLKSGHYLGAVTELAAPLGFVYKLHIVADFYLFIRDDVPRYSDNPYDAEQLQAAEATLTKHVISIVQDYERTMDDAFIDQLYHTLANESDDTEWYNTQWPSYQYSTSSEANCEHRDVYVAFIDIGFELEHPNLVDSTSLSLSHSFTGEGKNVKPDLYSYDVYGEWGHTWYEKLSHGTGCMGRVGATTCNGCDRGVAPAIKLVGLKALRIGGGVTDTREARALSYQWKQIDVFSCSYGIRDNIRLLRTKACNKNGLNGRCNKGTHAHGHDCRGVLYIYPSGNGHNDNCNADGYANSIYTITIAQVQMNGQLPVYTEICPAAIAATQGSGYSTTKLNGKCSDAFEGSSASCAVAAGFVGKLRFYRPCLSKRDIEHIMVRTALANENITWKTNGVGRKYNDQIGFGELVLHRMLETAKTWKYVPEVHTCAIQSKDTESKHVIGSNWISKSVVVSDGCRNKPNHVKYLEHVQVEMDLRCSNIFQVAIRLTSPSGTVSNILTSINISSRDISESFKTLHWNFTSVHFWGESSNGPWTIEVMVENSSVEVECKYAVTKLVLHGTDTDPGQGGNPLMCKESPVTDDGKEKSPMPHLAIAAIIFTAVVVIVIVVICIFKRNKRCRNKKQPAQPPVVEFHDGPAASGVNIVFEEQGLDQQLANPCNAD